MPTQITYTWVDGTTGDWSVGSNWSDGVVPTGTANATIGGSGAETVTVSSNQATNVLTLSDANATLAITNGATLTAYSGIVATACQEIDVDNGTLSFEGGSQTFDATTINLGSASSSGNIQELTGASGTLALGANLIVDMTSGSIATQQTAGNAIVNNGTIDLLGYGSLNSYAISNAGTISGAGEIDINAQSTFDNTGTISGSTVSVDYYIHGSVNNYNTITASHYMTFGYGETLASLDNHGTINGANLFISSNSLTNEIGGEIDWESDRSAIAYVPYNVPYNDIYCDSLTNYGSIKIGNDNIVGIIQSSSFDNEGTITIGNSDVIYAYFGASATNKNNGTITVNGRLVTGGTLGGTGSIAIGDGGVFEVSSGALSDAVAFTNGTVGTLQLDAKNLFTGTIAGLETGDAIDFRNLGVSGASASGTTLTVTFADNTTEAFTLTNPLAAGENVYATIDGAGGSEIVVGTTPPPPPPTYTWVDGTTGDWSVGSNWSDGVVPTGTANATIGGSGAETVTVSSNEATNVLTLSDANATLAITNGATLTAYSGIVATACQEIDVDNGTLSFEGGSQTFDATTINLGSASSSGNIQELTGASGTLALGANLIVDMTSGSIATQQTAGNAIVNNGTIDLLGYGSLNSYAISNAGTISGAGEIDINAQSTFDNTGTISGSTVSVDYYIHGSVNNYNTITASHYMTFGYGETLASLDNHGTINGANLFISSNSLTNEIGGEIDWESDRSAIAYVPYNVPYNDIYCDSLTNYGSIKIGNDNIVGIIQSSSFDNEGTITIGNSDVIYAYFGASATNKNNGTITVNGRLVTGGTLGGTGSIAIGDGGVFEVSSGALSDAVAFTNGTVGTLQLDAKNLFTGTIAGLETGDAIDFRNLGVSGASASGTTLTVTFADNTTEAFTLTNPLAAGENVYATIDGAGGSEIVVGTTPPPPPPTYTWVDGTTGDWSVGSNWSDGVVPTGTANATIGGSGAETVTVSSNEATNVLTLSDANATLAITNGATLTAYSGIVATACQEIDVDNGTLSFEGGSQTFDATTINLGSASSSGNIQELTGASGTLALGANLIVDMTSGSIATQQTAGNAIVNNGTIDLLGYGSLNSYAISNAGTISGAGEIDINAQSTFDNTGTISGSTVSVDYYIHGSVNNYNTITASHYMTFGYGETLASLDNHGTINGANLFISSNSLTNEIGGEIDWESDRSAIAYVPYNVPYNDIYCDSLTNYGSIKIGNDNIVGIIQSSSFDNEGTITIGNSDVIYAYFGASATNKNNGTITVNGRLVTGGTLGGTGSIAIGDGGVFEVSSGALSDAVAFTNGTVGTLQLDAKNLFTGTIAGLETGDAIDFRNLGVSGASASGTTLTVTFADNTTEAFTLTNPLASEDIVATQADANGGAEVLVLDSSTPGPVIATAEKAETGTIKAVGRGSAAPDVTVGVINFTDVTPNAQVTGTLQSQTVSVVDADGKALSLTSAEIETLETGFTLAPTSANIYSGAIDWTYSVADNASIS